MSNENSKVTDQSDDAEQTSIQPKCTTVRPERINIQRVQNVLLIWLDDNIDDNNADCRSTLTHLQQVINDINTFIDADPCIDFLTDICNENVCMLMSDSVCQRIISLIHDIVQLHSIFIFDENQTGDKQWIKQWPKITGVFTEASAICEVLKQTTQQCEQNAISISFVATGKDISKKNLDQLDPMFMYSQILKEILLTIEFNDEHIKQYTDYCRDVFASNDTELNKIIELQTKYHTRTPIFWYTFESFLYPMLNRALRLMDMDIIIKMGFFISDLHHHIQQLHSEQFTGTNSKQVFTIFRGQGMSNTDFDQMVKTQGGLLSFNNFLSTSKNRQVSLGFAHRALPNIDMKGILFVMTIDPTKSTTPFASIVNVGYYGNKEDEVLFSMHTVFRIGEITPIDRNPRLFQVQLTLTNDDDKDLRVLTDSIRNETVPDDEGWYRLGTLLLQVGESVKAQRVYEILLNQTTDVTEETRILHQLGLIKFKLGEYNAATTLYEKVLESRQQLLPSNHPDIALSYNNVGNVYHSMGDYPKALSCYEKALEVRKQSLPPDHPDLGSSYNNIGLVYYSMGDYLITLSYFEKALEIQKQSLPRNHPNFAAFYTNVGSVYNSMGNYPKALSYYQKGLKIKQQSLPSNHPDFGATHNNIGLVYYRMGDYPKALSSHEKALEIQQQSIPSNNPDLGSSYNNIGLVYYSMGNYPKALSYFEQAFEIRKKSLPSDHPDLSSSYNNIGLMYYSMQDYPKALSSFEQALEVRKQSLPSNHSELGASYANIGSVYHSMGDYRKALSSHEKALEIRQQSLPPNYPDLGNSYNNIGSLYYDMSDYTKALSSHENALEVRKKSLPPNHPDLGSSYNNIGLVYFKRGNYPKALSYSEKGLEIRQQSLPSNHPDLGGSCNSIGLVYSRMGDYPKALSYYANALEVQQQSLPSNHPDLAASYNNIGNVFYSIGDYPKALSYSEKGLEIRQLSLPSNHPDLAASYNNIGNIFYNIGDHPKAGSFYERAVKIGQHSLPTNHPHLHLYRKNLDDMKVKL